MKPEERDALIDELIDGTISEAEFLRLEAEFHVDRSAREAYYQRLKLATLLEIEAEEALSPSGGAARVVVPGPPWWRRRRWTLEVAAAIAALATGVLAGWLGARGAAEGSTADRDSTVPGTGTEPVAAGFAVIADQSGTAWGGGLVLGRGDLVPPGELVLESGTVQLELFSGVTVVLEGAARFEVLSPMEMTVDRGRVHALVPEPARGFRVRTSSGEIVDLGTEFSVDVTPDHADFRVLDGEVEWHPKGADAGARLLGEGEALRWTRDGRSLDLPFDGDEIAGIESVERGLADERRRRRGEWLAHGARLAEDPRLVAYFPMSGVDGGRRTLADASGNGHDGTLVRAARVADRWDHPAAAIDFSPTGSRVRVTVPEELRSLTLMCWVKIDGLDRWFNSLFLTDGHELNEPHWQIMDDGRLFFSVKKREPTPGDLRDKHVFFSPPFWSPALSGKWLHLATTYDVDARVVTHYLNGEPISREAIPERFLVETVRIGAASIGNWSEPKRDDPHFAVRNLNGAMDEFALFSEALDADEIAALHRIGRP